jgi:hypothetical protein
MTRGLAERAAALRVFFEERLFDEETVLFHECMSRA